jgi:pilus assembly protein CpaB
MAQRRYTIVFYAALFIAGLATYGVYRVLHAAKTSARIAVRPVVVAAKDIPAGAALQRDLLEVKQWPAVSVPKGALTSVAAAGGRVTRVPVFAGEAIVPGRLAREGTAPGLEARITPGMRAMSVRINDVAGMSGLIQPNSRVDVLVSLREQSSNGSPEEVSKLFLENMRVLSMGARTTRDDSGDPSPASTATLEVTPTQAEKLAVAMRHGNIQLVLRGFDDSDSTRTKGSTSSEVLAQLRIAKPTHVVAQTQTRPAPRRAPEVKRDVPPPVAVAPPVANKPDSLTVRVYRGNQVTQQKFQVDTANGNGTRNGSETP